MSPQNTRHCFLRAFFLTAAPLLGLSAPLWFHLSPHPVWATYSLAYACGLCGWHLLIIVLALWLARHCQRAGNLHATWTAVLLTALLIILAGAAEWFLRAQHPDSFARYREWGHKKSMYGGFEARPLHHWEFAGASYTTDPFGLRIHLQDPAWPTRRGVRVFILGGSSAFGYGLNDDETWAHQLEDRHNRARPDRPLTFVNAGNNGHSSFQTFLRYYIKVLPHRPAAVVLYQNYNDISRNPRSAHAVAVPESQLFSGSTADYWAKQQRRYNFYARTLLYKTWLDLRQRLAAGPPAGDDEPVAYMDEDVYWEIQRRNGRLFIQNIDALAVLCRRHGTELIITTFIHDDKNMPSTKSRSVRYYNKLLRDYAQQEGLAVIDLEKAFAGISDKVDYFFEDHYHPNRKGATFIAGQMADYFAARDVARAPQESP